MWQPDREPRGEPLREIVREPAAGLSRYERPVPHYPASNGNYLDQMRQPEESMMSTKTRSLLDKVKESTAALVMPNSQTLKSAARCRSVKKPLETVII